MALTKSVNEIIKHDKSGLLGKHSSWERVKVKYIALVTNGYPFESKYFSSTKGVPLIRIRDIVSGETNTFFDAEYNPDFLIQKDDFLIGMDGDFNSARWKGNPALLNQRVCKVSMKKSEFYLSKFLEFAIPSYLDAIHAETSSVTVKHLSSRTIEDIELPLPPLKEQTRIVTKLEELFSELDAGVNELKTAQAKLVQYRQSLLKAAVEGELSLTWRESRPIDDADETGAQLLERILIERRQRWEEKQLAKFAEQGKQPPKDWQKKYPEPVQPDTTDLPKLPDGWVWATVEQLGIVQLGRQRSPSKMHGISPVKYIRAANITEVGVNLDDVLEMDFSEKEIETFKLKRGDILLTEASGSAEHVGRPAIWTKEDDVFCFQNTVIRFRSQGLNTDFAFYTFLAYQKLGKFRQVSGGVGINHLSAGKFSNIAIPLPSLNEQQAITSILESLLDQVKNQSVALEQSFKQSAAQRKNILRAAFAGKLVPQDPNDEPASVLLERIQAERQAQTSASKTSAPKTRKAVNKRQAQLSLED